MKRLMGILLMLTLLLTLSGCDTLEEENHPQNEEIYENEQVEYRTYKGSVYNKAYYSSAEDRTTWSNWVYVFSETDHKVVSERTGGFKNQNKENCHVYEGTYEGEIGDKVVITYTMYDNKAYSGTDTYSGIDTIEFKDGKAYHVISESSKKSLSQGSPTSGISRAKSCLAKMGEN